MITAIRQVKHLKRKQKYQVIWAEDGCQRSNSTFDLEADAELFREHLQDKMSAQTDSTVASPAGEGAIWYTSAALEIAKAALESDDIATVEVLSKKADVLAKASKVSLDHQDTTELETRLLAAEKAHKELKQAAKHGQVVGTSETGKGSGIAVRRDQPIH